MPLFVCVKYLNKNTHITHNFYFNFSIIAVKLFFLLMAFKYASARNAINFQENSGCFIFYFYFYFIFFDAPCS